MDLFYYFGHMREIEWYISCMPTLNGKHCKIAFKMQSQKWNV